MTFTRRNQHAFDEPHAVRLPKKLVIPRDHLGNFRKAAERIVANCWMGTLGIWACEELFQGLKRIPDLIDICLGRDAVQESLAESPDGPYEGSDARIVRLIG